MNNNQGVILLSLYQCSLSQKSGCENKRKSSIGWGKEKRRAVEGRKDSQGDRKLGKENEQINPYNIASISLQKRKQKKVLNNASER